MPTNSAPELMRPQSRSAILETIQERGPISRVDLARLLKLNPATVTRITRLLLEEDLICETGEGTTPGAGRKPTLLSFNHRARLLTAIYAGRNGVTGVIADTSGAILTRHTLLPDPALASQTFHTLLNELLAADPSYRRRLASACLCAAPPAQITPGLCDSISETLDIPVITAEDVELAALGEATWGAGRERPHFGLLWLGHTSRFCLYLDGILRAGGLGYDAAGQPFAARLSDRGLVIAAQSLLENDTTSAIHDLTQTRRLSARLIFEAAQQHDPLARAVIDTAAGDLAQVVLGLADVLTLDLMILGGAWTPAAPLLIPAVYEHLHALGTPLPTVITAELGDDAPLLGAIKLALDHSGLTG